MKVKKFNIFHEHFEKSFNEWAKDKIIIDQIFCSDTTKSSLIVFYREA